MNSLLVLLTYQKWDSLTCYNAKHFTVIACSAECEKGKNKEEGIEKEEMSESVFRGASVASSRNMILFRMFRRYNAEMRKTWKMRTEERGWHGWNDWWRSSIRVRVLDRLRARNRALDRPRVRVHARRMGVVGPRTRTVD